MYNSPHVSNFKERIDTKHEAQDNQKINDMLSKGFKKSDMNLEKSKTVSR